jgi:HEAT repeat protein
MTLSLHLIDTAERKELLPFALQHTSWDAFSKTFRAVAALKILSIERLETLPPAIYRLLHNISFSVLQSDVFNLVLSFTSPVQELPSLAVLYCVLEG